MNAITHHIASVKKAPVLPMGVTERMLSLPGIFIDDNGQFTCINGVASNSLNERTCFDCCKQRCTQAGFNEFIAPGSRAGFMGIHDVVFRDKLAQKF